jgi:PAS domain S-box-containing protein
MPQEEFPHGNELPDLQINFMPLACIIWDRDFRAVAWNPAAKKIFGYSPEEAMGKHPYEIIVSKDVQPHVDDVWRRLLLGDETAHSVNENFTKDGRQLICEWHNAPLRKADGSVVGVLSIVQNITERTKKEKEQQENQRKYQAVFAQLYQFIGLMRPDGILIEANQTALDFIRCQAGDVVGKPFWQTPWWRHSEEVQEQVRQAIVRANQSEFIRFETTVCGGDGNIINIDFSIKALKDESGAITFLIPEGRDITERKRVEMMLRLEESRLEALLKLNQMAEASLQDITDFVLEETVRLTKSKIGYLAFLNEDETVMTMHSWSKSAMAECAIMDKPIIYPVVNTGLWGEAVRQRKPVITNNYEAPNPLKKGYPEGHVKVQRHMNAPVFDGNKIVVVSGVGNKEEDYNASDVRQLILMMQGMWRLIQRKRIADQLKKAMEMNNEFTSVVSHELRTPLAAIKMGMDMLTDGVVGALNEEQGDICLTVSKNIDRLSRLVNSVLDLQRMKSGKAPLNLQENSIGEALNDVYAMMVLAARAKGLYMVVEVEPDLPRIRFDKDKIIEVLTNLVNNAIKFTESGSIRMVACKDGNSVHVKVSDTGCGIKRENMSKLFGTFQRIESPDQPSVKGAGLGLAISKEIIEQHHGKIWAESDIGQGCRFHFLLPIQERRKTY